MKKKENDGRAMLEELFGTAPTTTVGVKEEQRIEDFFSFDAK